MSAQSTSQLVVGSVIEITFPMFTARINAVSPGVIKTPWWDKLPRDLRESLLQQTAAASPVGRNGSAAEAGSAITFLISNGFVSGTVLEIDGGLHLV